LREGASLPDGTTVKTEPRARVEVSLGPRGSIMVGPSTTLDLEASPQAGRAERVRVSLGRVWLSIIKRFDPDARFEVVTPSAVVSVRGTLFSVSAEDDGTSRVSVQLGLVDVASLGEGDSSSASADSTDLVPVPAGMQTRVSRARSPERAVKMERSEQVSWAEVDDWAQARFKAERAAGSKDRSAPAKNGVKAVEQPGQDKASNPGKGNGNGTANGNGSGSENENNGNSKNDTH
jgi:hypothetical protein